MAIPQSLRLRVTPRIPPLQVELRNTGAMIQWRLGKDGDWRNLLAIADISPTVTVGNVTTADDLAGVQNVGTGKNVVLEFSLPKGAQGDAATIDIGDVTTVNYDDPATVINTGSRFGAVLDFQIPRGLPGPPLGDGDMGDVVIEGGVWTVAPGVIDNAKLAAMPAGAVKGRALGAGDGDPMNLLPAQLAELVGYSEGVWTPELTFGGGNTGLAYGPLTAGRYTRIGRLVIASFHLQLTSKGTSTGVAVLSGLPFHAGANPPLGSLATTWLSAMAAINGAVVGIVNAGAQTVSLYASGTGTASALSNIYFTNSSQLQATIIYEAQ